MENHSRKIFVVDFVTDISIKYDIHIPNSDKTIG